VGPSPAEDTELGCFWNAPALVYQVYYRAGKEYYFVDATYEQKGATVEVHAGPLSEDETLTPWTLMLR
jgi:hypothetical protein